MTGARSEILLLTVILLSLAGASRAGEQLPPVEVTAPRSAPPDAGPTPTSLDRGDLESRDVSGTRDLGALAPGLTVNVSGDRKSPFIGLRGLTNAFVGDTSVGLYVDDVPYSDVRGSLIDLYDFARVDVLRGPQTTTFGRAAEAGAINVVSPEPSDAVHGRASVRLGNYDAQVYQASAGGALWRDVAYLDVAGLEARRDGFVRNVFRHEPLDDRDLAAGHGRLVVRPLPRLELTFVGDGHHADDGAQVYVHLGQADPFKVAYDTNGRGLTDGALGAMTARWDGPGVVVRSITARRWVDSHDNQLDFDFTPAPAAVLMDDYSFVDWTQELRAESADPDARLRWRLGGFFEDRATTPDVTIRVGSGSAALRNEQVSDLDYRTGAGFGRASLRLLPALDLTGGLRIEDTRVTIDHQHRLEPASGPSTLAAPPLHDAIETFAWLPHASLDWVPLAATRLWTSAARSYRAGGFSYLADDATARFRPEFGWTYNAGVEQRSWRDRLTTALDFFWIRQHDYQDIRQLGLTSFTVRNAQQSTFRGIEAAAEVAAGGGLTLSTNAAWVDAHYDRYHDKGRFDGNRVAFAPEYTFSVGADWRHPLGAAAHVDVGGVGAYPFLSNNQVGQEPYALLNVRLGWEWTHFGVYAYGRNLTDETYFAFALPLGPGAGYATSPGDPRVFRVMALGRF